MLPGENTTDPAYELVGGGNSDDGLVVYVRVRNARINVVVRRQDFDCSPTALEALVTNRARFVSVGNDEEDKLWEYIRDYYECYLKFCNENPDPSAILPKIPNEEDDLDCDYVLPAPSHWPFSLIHNSDIEVPCSDSTDIFADLSMRVYVQDMPFTWKQEWDGGEAAAMVHKHSRIVQSNISSDRLLVSKLYGIVVDERSFPRGQLYYWVDFDRDLTRDNVERASEETRARWVSQLSATVTALHEIDVAWGDVKAGNVVIDENDNAVLTDRLKGATRPWIDEEMLGTKQGDLQGLERIVDYIHNDESTLPLEEKQMTLDLEAGVELD